MYSYVSLISETVPLSLATAFIYWMGRHEHARLSKTSYKKRIHGQFIPEWVAIGFAFPAISMLCFGISVVNGSPGVIGMCFFGLLCGLAIGWVHGTFRLLRHSRLDIAEDVVSFPPTREDGNPYRPPNGT